MRSRRVLIFIAFAAMMSFPAVAQAMTSGAAWGSPAPAPQEAADATAPRLVAAAADRLLELTNASRAAEGLEPLAPRDDATGVAEGWSLEMARAGDIAHNDAYFSAESKRRLGARTLGENVALNTDVDDAHRRLMDSPGHRANLLSTRFKVIGLAAAQLPDGRLFVTENFVEPASTPAVTLQTQPIVHTSAAASPAVEKRKVAGRTPTPEVAADPAGVTDSRAVAPEPASVASEMAAPSTSTAAAADTAVSGDADAGRLPVAALIGLGALAIALVGVIRARYSVRSRATGR